MSISPYGNWKSPISSKFVTTSGVGLQELRVDINSENTDVVYWSELRYEEQGRFVVCSYNKNTKKIDSWTPSDFNVRTLVHEYGGGAFFVFNGAVYFSNFQDQVMYIQKSADSTPEAVTEVGRKWRYADGFYSVTNERIYCIREDHEAVENGKAKEAVNTVVVINPDKKTQNVLVSGADFYSCPHVSSDGKRVCWMQWNHPNMPWDNTEVWIADLTESGEAIVSGSAKKVAGGDDVSVMIPTWTHENELLYVGDQTNWWNLYKVSATDSHTNLLPKETEIGGPHWVFGSRAKSYCLDPSGSGKLLTTFGGELGVLDSKAKEYKMIETGFGNHSFVALTTSGDIYCLAASPTKYPCVISVSLKTGKVNIILESCKIELDKGYCSVPTEIEWPTANGEKCHGFYYPPQNKDFVAPEKTFPPLLVRAHGGPTSAYSSNFDIKIQYWTSRGFAVLTVNYRGSTSYGKKYRHRLRRNWGICDVEDCCSGALHLVDTHKADANKLCIDGGSAGGYTTLACLTFKTVFKAGASHYGIGDLSALAKDTHKFESRYLDSIIAPYDTDENKKIYAQRSPMNYTDNLNCAMAFFQGDEDKVVPPDQSVKMYESVKAKKLPALLEMFKGEQHGFRKAENIQKALDVEFYFFGKVLGFEPADKHINVKIDNLE